MEVNIADCLSQQVWLVEAGSRIYQGSGLCHGVALGISG